MDPALSTVRFQVPVMIQNRGGRGKTLSPPALVVGVSTLRKTLET